MFKKFYEEGNEVDYETVQPVTIKDVWKPLDEVFLSLKEVNVVDVYYNEVEVVDQNITYPTIVVDVYMKDGKNFVYLIYVKDMDEYNWRVIKEEIAKKYKTHELNVCDEDDMYLSFCT